MERLEGYMTVGVGEHVEVSRDDDKRRGMAKRQDTLTKGGGGG